MTATSFDTIITDMKAKGLFNEIKTVESEQGAYLTIQGKKYLNLCSNNYLGLASDSRLKEAAIKAIQEYGVGTASVRALIGTNQLHLELEKKIADFKGAESAMVVSSGYMANLAAIQTLLGKEDMVISDELNHGSIIDGIRMAGVKNKFIYKHNDVADLRRQIPEIKELLDELIATGEKRKALIITDGVFSMDGDLAPLPELVVAAKEIGAMIMVDDAHGEGVLGTSGRGIVDHFNLQGQIDIEVGTLSKAFGVLGGFITGKKSLIDFYRQKARQSLLSTGLSIPDTAALIAAVDIMQQSDELVKKLWVNAEYLRTELKKQGFDTGVSVTPIVPIMIGEENRAKEFAKQLYGYGVMVIAIKFPMVAMGKARIRLQPSALHTKKDIDFGLEKIQTVGKALQVI